jgi:hypothetical protein
MHSFGPVASGGGLPGKIDLAFGAERFRLLSLGEKTDNPNIKRCCEAFNLSRGMAI